MTARLDTRGEARVHALIGGDATPKVARKEADLLRKQAPNQYGDRQDEMRRDSELLDAWASREETRERELQHVLDDVTSDKPEPHVVKSDAPKPKARTGRKSTTRRPSSKRKQSKRTTKGPIGRAIGQAVIDQPQTMAASTIRQGGSLFWTLALGTIALIFVYVLVANGKRASDLIEGIGRGASRIAYPRVVFPERYEKSFGPQLQSARAPSTSGLRPIATTTATTTRRV